MEEEARGRLNVAGPAALVQRRELFFVAAVDLRAQGDEDVDHLGMCKHVCV